MKDRWEMKLTFILESIWWIELAQGRVTGLYVLTKMDQ
jgi:hypothetical protein